MSDDLSGNWSDEIRRANLIKELGASTVSNLQPFYPYGERPVIAPTDQLMIEDEEATILKEAVLDTENCSLVTLQPTMTPSVRGE